MPVSAPEAASSAMMGLKVLGSASWLRMRRPPNWPTGRSLAGSSLSAGGGSEAGGGSGGGEQAASSASRRGKNSKCLDLSLFPFWDGTAGCQVLSVVVGCAGWLFCWFGKSAGSPGTDWDLVFSCGFWDIGGGCPGGGR